MCRIRMEKGEEKLDTKITEGGTAPDENGAAATTANPAKKDDEEPPLLDPFTISEEDSVEMILKILKLDSQDQKKMAGHRLDLKKLCILLGGTFALELISNFLNQLTQFKSTAANPENDTPSPPPPLNCLKALDMVAITKYLESDPDPNFPLADVTILTTIHSTVTTIRESAKGNGRVNVSRMVERLAFSYGENILRRLIQIAASAQLQQSSQNDQDHPSWPGLMGPVENLISKYLLTVQKRTVPKIDEPPPENMEVEEKNEEEAEEKKLVKKVVKKPKKKLTTLQNFAQPIKDFYATIIQVEPDGDNGTESVEILLSEVLSKSDFALPEIAQLEFRRTIAMKLIHLGKYHQSLEMLEEIFQIEKKLQIDTQNEASMAILYSMAQIYETLGHWDASWSLCSKLVKQQEAHLGNENPETLKTRQLTATLLFHKGRYEESLKMCDEIFELRTKILGPHHPHTLETEQCKGLLLLELSTFPEALTIFKKIFDILFTTLKFPSTHPQLLSVSQNIAICLNYEKNPDQVLKLMEDVIDKYKKHFGNVDHPSCLFCEELLANFFISQQRMGEAKEIFDKLLTLYTQIYGQNETHPRIIAVRESLANILLKKKEFEEAEKNLREIVKIRLKNFGPSHHHTIHCQHTLITVLCKNKKEEEALGIFREILHAQQNFVGPTHDYTLLAKANLAKFLQHQPPGSLGPTGNGEEAGKFFEEIYQHRLKNLGPDHLDTLKSQSDIANLLETKKDLDGALQIYRQVYDLKMTKFGAENSETLSTLGNIAWLVLEKNENQAGKEEALKLFENISASARTSMRIDNCDLLTHLYTAGHGLYTEKKFKEALQSFKELLHFCKTILGPDHRDTANVVANIGTIVHHLGRYGEAVGMYEDAVEIHKKNLDTDPLPLIQTMESMSSLLADQGKYTMATRMLDDICEIVKAAYKGDEEHPLVLRARHGKGVILNKQDKKKESEALLEQVFEARKRILGPKHPDTLETDYQISMSKMQERMARSRFFRGGFGAGMFGAGGLFADRK